MRVLCISVGKYFRVCACSPRVCVCGTCVCVHPAAVRALLRHGADRRYLKISLRRAGGRVCFLCGWCHRPVSCAGASWTSRTTSAPWAARSYHTSVIDATGAIYVIGGFGTNGGTTRYNDVYVSIDKGAWPDPVGGGRVGTVWVLGGTRGVLEGVPTGYSRSTMLNSTRFPGHREAIERHLKGTRRVLAGYSRGTRRGTRGVLGGVLGG